MTPDQITQLRQSAKQAKEIIGKAIEWGKSPKDVDLYCNNALDALDRILDLLPCPTCNGTEEKIKGTYIDHISGAKLGVLVPCPDCK